MASPKRLIADVPKEFHDRLKLACALSGQTIQRFALDSLEPRVEQVLAQSGVKKFQPSGDGRRVRAR